MSDLVWRLRKNMTASHLCGLAADEIERLRELCGQPSATVSEGGEERVSAATSSPHDLVEISVEAIRDCIRANDMREAAYVRAVLTAIEKAGHRIVPVKITREMRQAGLLTDTMDGWDGPETCWEWMLDAAPKVTP